MGGYRDSGPSRPRRSWSLYGARVLREPSGDGHRRRAVLPEPLALERDRALVAERGMPSLAVVEPLDVLEDLTPCVRPRGPDRLLRQLDLHRREEALGHGVVPAVTASA